MTFHTVAAFVRLLRVAAGLRVALRRKCDFPAQGQKEAYLAWPSAHYGAIVVLGAAAPREWGQSALRMVPYLNA